MASRRACLLRLASLSKAGGSIWIVRNRKGPHHHRKARPSAGYKARERLDLTSSRCNERHSPVALQAHSLEQKACPSSTDRKSTRLNSSHGYISYAVFCLKKK